MVEKIVQINHITKKYKECTVLDDVSLSIRIGDVIGLVGGNGAGKTTLMRAIAGSIPVDSGEIIFSGERRTQDVGTLIENPNIYTDMSGIENLRYFGRLFGVEDETVYESLLQQMGLAEAGKKLVGRYSLGMKQRLGIAVAMLGDPRLLILDEPLNGLDVQGMQDLEERLLAMHENRSIGILISSHMIGELVKLCNRYLVMDHGRICMEYTREEQLQQAGSEEAVENYIITRFQKSM